MRKIDILGAFIAVLAFSALAVANASATLWLSNGRSLEKETVGSSHGTIVFHHEGGTGNAEITCSGLFIGTYGPLALDKVTLVESLGGEIDLVKCTLNAGFCASPVLHPEGLPWHTLLVLMANGETLDEFLTSAYVLLCFGFAEILCSKNNASATFVKNGVNGAEFSYTKAGTETTCSDGGKGWITGKGEVLGFTVS